MKALSTLRFVSALIAISIVASFGAMSPASAITVELATKCREMAIKAHPRQTAGSKVGTASLERKYYRACVANGGSPPEEKVKKPAAPPAR